MTRRARRFVLAAIAVLGAAMLVIVLANQHLLLDAKPPAEPASMAQWLTAHPADWRTASAISAAALDSSSPRRVTLWREAYAHAKRLAPLRTTANEAFVRGGLFHWYELGAPERALVLEAATPLLRDPNFFEAMHISLWQLTRDMRWLRSVAPDAPNVRNALRALAVTRGLFDDYRGLRDDIHRASLRGFEAQRNEADPAALLKLLETPVEKSDEPLVRGILEELDRRTFDAAQLDGRIEHLVDYAVRHDVQPLSGLLPVINAERQMLTPVTRARAALDMGDPTLATRIELASAVTGAPEWDAYYLDRARFEARRGDAAAARGHLARAAVGGTTLAILAAEEDVAKILGRSTDEIRAQLVARTQQPLTWVGMCGMSEICAFARTTTYVLGDHLELTLTTTQTDETAPYVEIFVDDARVAEGDVRETRTFRVPASGGLHDVEVRLVNPRTRNGIQRRVRLS